MKKSLYNPAYPKWHPPLAIPINTLSSPGLFDFSDLEPLSLSKIKRINFPAKGYYSKMYEKKQIVLHHTVSGPGIRGDIGTWINDVDRIATCIIVDHNGIPNQLYSSRNWAHHLGIRQDFLKNLGFNDYRTRNRKLNQESIGIEIDNWGWLIKHGDKYKTFYGNTVDSEVITYAPFWKGHHYFESYKEDQLRTIGELLLYWNKVYDIPLDYNEDMWDVSKRALEGTPGIWSHVSFRNDKTDCHPDPNLIHLLKTLSDLSNK